MSIKHLLKNRQYATVSLNFNGNFNEKMSKWMQQYEDFVGLTEVKAAQLRVLEAERKFVKSQELRREMQRQISGIQQRLRELHTELDRTNRGEDKYLALVTQEHAIIKEEKKLRVDFQDVEKEERENFAALSHAVRDSHEKERAQAEKTKYWSIIGSVAGTLIGIFGTTVNNRMRMRELRELVQDTAKANTSVANFDEVARNLLTALESQKTSFNRETTHVGGADLRKVSESLTKQLDRHFSQLLSDVHRELDTQKSFLSDQRHRLESVVAAESLGTHDRLLVLHESEIKTVKRDLLKTVFLGTMFASAVSWTVIKLLNG